ncbi:Peptidase family M23 [Ruminococcus sp. YE71]|uniref:murein hydrolase activator EnvC family protein n=1 Tax=unclassified Ruminococcus TaxID=2608920 RepID=UPI0008873151|nr:MULTISPECIES: M23 family metallopeptidase [unclassified Ruminococcus]SDA27666.1 Peptidase family M23 [Ruminococcus sp. YE78]SFW45876.1 Peptidase family M23 [Ruminococcus sp. YE71]
MKTAAKARLKRIAAYALAISVAAAAFTDAASIRTMANSSSSSLSSDVDAKDKEITSTENDIADLEKKQAELDAKLKETEGNIAAQEERKKLVSEQILTIEATLHKLAESIGELEKSIRETEQDIARKEAAVESKKQEIIEGVDGLKKRLRVMYIAGSDSYTGIIVGADNFYDMLMKIELIKRVANHDNELIDNLMELKAQYEEEEQELSIQKGKLEDELGTLQDRRNKQTLQKQKLEALYRESELSIGVLKSDKENYEKNKAQIDAEHAKFEEDLMKLFEERKKLEEEEKKKKEEEDKKKKDDDSSSSKGDTTSSKGGGSTSSTSTSTSSKSADDTSSQTYDDSSSQDDSSSTSYEPDSSSEDDSSYYYEEDSSEDDSYDDSSSESGGGQTNYYDDPNEPYGYVRKTNFTWPVPGYYYISYGVGWRWGAYHAGIDIWSEGIRGHNIVAADSGTVILVSNTCTHDWGKNGSCGCGGGYGNYCIIDHGGGWWTLYGHSEGIIVSQGQYVKQGQKLGTVGSTGYSTGPHLHFEVRKDGVALNPSDYV